MIIARGGKPVARLTAVAARRPKVVLGSDRGKIRIASDFDDTPDDFAPYEKP